MDFFSLEFFKTLNKSNVQKCECNPRVITNGKKTTKRYIQKANR